MSEKSKSPVPIVVGVVVVLAGAFLMLREPEQEPETIDAEADAPAPAPVASHTTAPAPAPTPAEPTPAEPAEPSEPAEPDPPKMPPPDFFAGELDDALADGHAMLLDRRPFSIPMMKRLVAYREAHPDDGRANLLLAYDAMERGADGHAVRLYRMAWQNDADIARDPRVLEDLVEILATHDRVEYREGSEAIEMMYGRDALGAIEARLEKARANSRPKQVERLERLKERLREAD